MKRFQYLLHHRLEFSAVTLSCEILKGNDTFVKNVLLSSLFNQILERRQSNIAMEIRFNKSKCVEKKKDLVISKDASRI